MQSWQQEHCTQSNLLLVGRSISPQSSVTCNGEYRRPVIKAEPSFHDVDAENGERKRYVEYV